MEKPDYEIDWHPIRQTYGNETEPDDRNAFYAKVTGGWLMKFYVGTAGNVVFMPEQEK